MSSRTQTRIIEHVDAEAMKVIAALMDDPNPIHFDAQAARDRGLGDLTVNQGPTTISYVLDLAAEMAGGPERVKRFQARLIGNVFDGDRVEIQGTLTPKDAGAVIELVARTARGVVVEGRAEVLGPA